MLYLRPGRGTTGQHGDGWFKGFTELMKHVLDLKCQFAGGGEDKNTSLIVFMPFIIEALQNRQNKGRSFPGTGRGAGQYILTCQ